MDRTSKNKPQPFCEVLSSLYPERQPHLHAMMLNCGHQLVVPESYYRWNGLQRGPHDFALWQYTVSGTGALDYNGKTILLPPGTGMLLTVPEKHCYYLPKESDFWEFEFMTFYGSETVRLTREFRSRFGSVIQLDQKAVPVKMLHEILLRKDQTFIANRYQTSAFVYRFIMEMLSLPLPEPASGSRIDTGKIHEYILKNMDRLPDVDELAEIAGCSRWHFTRNFTREKGVSPHQFILNLKIQFALRLLQTTHLPIKEISRQCGFEDVSYFCKVFKRILDTTPAAFRNGKTIL